MATKRDTPRRELSVEQLNAIDCLVVGKTDRETAETVGVGRQTVNEWRNHHPAFQAALNARRHDVWGGAGDRLRALLPCALDALEHALTEGKDWKAAVAVIGLAGLDRQGYGVPNLGPYSIGPTDPAAFEPAAGRGGRAARLSHAARIDEIEAARDGLLDGTLPIDRIDRMLNG